MENNSNDDGIMETNNEDTKEVNKVFFKDNSTLKDKAFQNPHYFASENLLFYHKDVKFHIDRLKKRLLKYKQDRINFLKRNRFDDTQSGRIEIRKNEEDIDYINKCFEEVKL